ncbi:MAG: TrbC/VirB2 family protein [Candidatus Altiarchaeota archaeon]|nr:TrbC/VirB2 family protein [Candidatus Altiarchaeota archaeon]
MESLSKAVTVLLLAIFLAESAYAGCDPTKCQIDQTKVEITHEIYWGDEIRFSVKFTNEGSEKCCYRAVLFDADNFELERSPNDFWLRLESGESGTIKLSSVPSLWDACSLENPPPPGKGEAKVTIIGALPNPNPLMESLECELGFSNDPLDSTNVCPFGGIDPHLFVTPPGCCGEYEGIACLEYGQTYGGLTCDDSIQVNPNVPCLVECKYDESAAECSCTLVEACAMKCDAGPPAACVYDDFICMGLHYKCSNGAEPEVKCSNTVDCKYQCASKCGREATCSTDCENCCNSPLWCNKVSMYAYGNEEKKVCMENCMGVCRANEELCNVLYIIYGVAAGISILLIMFHGMKWMLSDDIEGRQDAKRGIAYVFVGLILIITAASLANYFFTGSFTC